MDSNSIQRELRAHAGCDFTSTSEAVAALQERISSLPEALRAPIPEPPEPLYCGSCGGVKNEESPLFDKGGCRCGGRKRRLLSMLDAIDPEQKMTFETMKDLDPSMVKAHESARRIACGERHKGMLMLGKPGLGKTHLLIALGRRCLLRDIDCGYYNVARLVSRIQDSYSNFPGTESRRAIVESVASHEVVLLDDLGKEHQSSNVESIIYELIDALYAAKRTVVLSTNVPPKKEDGYEGKTLGERYDEAVRSRIKAMCERFVIKGEDRRSWDW